MRHRGRVASRPVTPMRGSPKLILGAAHRAGQDSASGTPALRDGAVRTTHTELADPRALPPARPGGRTSTRLYAPTPSNASERGACWIGQRRDLTPSFYHVRPGFQENARRRLPGKL